MTLVEERGDPLRGRLGRAGSGGSGGRAPGPPVAIPADGGPWIAVGRSPARPAPSSRNPPDPACAERPVAGAVIVVRDGYGAEVARATTAADGTFLVGVPGGGTLRRGGAAGGGADGDALRRSSSRSATRRRRGSRRTSPYDTGIR